MVIMVMVHLAMPHNSETLVIDQEGSQYLVMERSIYLNTVIKGNFEVSILCYFILLSHYISGGYIVLCTPVTSDSYSYKLFYRLNMFTHNIILL